MELLRPQSRTSRGSRIGLEAFMCGFSGAGLSHGCGHRVPGMRFLAPRLATELRKDPGFVPLARAPLIQALRRS
ncbi:hypothetical protein DPEC_G00115570 [Dallia pectoralis]|uniref:Uncharacterized protein n=1 Tax=Dallia pectoralis TaxID=75939 RepID=A0ACC2GUE4_DALPE|nr:hypothetical protein DPEC_G00115570 [Dallia pectoralis]